MNTCIVNLRSSNGGLYSTEIQNGLNPTACKRRGFVIVHLTLVGMVVMALLDSNPAQFVTSLQITYKFKLWLYEKSSGKRFFFYYYLDQSGLTMINGLSKMSPRIYKVKSKNIFWIHQLLVLKNFISRKTVNFF